MKNQLYCFNCNKDVYPNEEKQKNVYVVHKRKIEIEENILLCPICKNELYDKNLDDSLFTIYNKYLKLYGLSFEKLKEIRNSYNLSQELFAKALGWSKKTIVRYENALSLPQKQYLQTYQKIANDKYEFLNILKSNEWNIDEKTYYKIYSSVNTQLDLKTINVFLYTLNNNFLTKTQIMKYLFSIDFLSFKKMKKSITTLKYAHGLYGPIIDNKDSVLELLVKNNYLSFANNETDDILFKPIQDCNTSLFTNEELEIMNKVINTLKGKKAAELSLWSHDFIGWKNTKNGEIIDYSYAEYFELIKRDN